MAKYLNRLNARIARAALAESAKESKSWIVSRKLILETEEGDMEFEKGDVVEIGATDEGDMAIGGNSAAVVVVSDADLASKIADVVVSADELSDVKFVEKPALDAMLDGENVDDVIDNLADAPMEDEGADMGMDNIEVAELDIEQQESIESKFGKFSENRMNPEKAYLCEAIQIDEEDTKALNMSTIKADRIAKESAEDYSKFVARVSELKGSLQPGEKEVALSESGKVIGMFNKEANTGILFLENSFESLQEMEEFDADPEDLVQDTEFGEGCEEAVEESLKAFEESAKSGQDYIKLVESLTEAKVEEATIAKIIATFDAITLKECVRVYDSKFGKFVAAFKENVEADNFIAETAEEKRFNKRFFA